MTNTTDDNPFQTTKETEPCPKCGSDLVIKSGGSGAFWGCSSYPECDYTRPLSNAPEMHVVKVLDDVCCPECGGDLGVKSGKFGMFIGCMEYPDCTFMVKENDDEEFEPIPCPSCDEGQIHMRTNKKGKTFYACDQYPKCDYLVNQKPIHTSCEACGWDIMVEHQDGLQCPQCQHKQSL